MKKFLKKVAKSFHSGEKGFTLIELLIVIVILGVLAAAIIPNLSRFVGSGNVAKANAELASIRTGIAAYQSEHGGLYPCTIQPTDLAPQAVLTAAGTGVATYITGTIDGTYVINGSGVIIVNAGTTYPGMTFDGTKWNKS